MANIASRVGQPEGVVGSITFDPSNYRGATTAKGVRAADGTFWVQSVNPHLWLKADIRAEQFMAV